MEPGKKSVLRKASALIELPLGADHRTDTLERSLKTHIPRQAQEPAAINIVFTPAATTVEPDEVFGLKSKGGDTNLEEDPILATIPDRADGETEIGER